MNFEMNYLIVYSEIEITCLVLLIGVGTMIHTDIGSRVSKGYFLPGIVSIIFGFMVDVISHILLYTSQGDSLQGFIFFKSLFFASGIMASYFWFVYYEYIQNSSFSRYGWKVKAYAFLPAAAGLILLFINFFTGIIFSADTTYRRGPFNLLPCLLIAFYLAFSIGRVYYSAGHTLNRNDRRLLYTAGNVMLLPILLLWIQYIFWWIPLFCVGITCAILQLYLFNVRQQITIEPMTGLNTKEYLAHHGKERLYEVKPGNRLYFILMDVNNFKQINDRYGHAEGDQALILFSSILAETFAETKNPLLVRYGGDEFVVLYEVEMKKEIELGDILKEEELLLYQIPDEVKPQILALHRRLFNCQKKWDLPYQLEASVGAVLWSDTDYKDTEEMLKEADQAMYANKIHRKVELLKK